MADPRPNGVMHAIHVDRNGGYSGYNVAYVESPAGVVQLEICDECHYIFATCEHARCEWDEAETTLTCLLCGIDRT